MHKINDGNTFNNIAQGKHLKNKWKESKFAAIGHSVCLNVYDMETNQDFNRDKFVTKLLEDKKFLHAKDSMLGSFAFFLLNEIGLHDNPDALRDVRIAYVDTSTILAPNRDKNQMSSDNDSTTVHINVWKSKCCMSGSMHEGPWKRPTLGKVVFNDLVKSWENVVSENVCLTR